MDKAEKREAFFKELDELQIKRTGYLDMNNLYRDIIRLKDNTNVYSISPINPDKLDFMNNVIKPVFLKYYPEYKTDIS